jgi:putative membrane protein
VAADNDVREPASGAAGATTMSASAADAATMPAGGDSAPRRTSLAAERTYLAWLRTGLAALGLALAVGRLIPALIDVHRAPFAALGLGYGLFGAFLIAYAAYNTLSVRSALAKNGPLPDDRWAIVVTSVAGLALAFVTIVLVLVEL